MWYDIFEMFVDVNGACLLALRDRYNASFQLSQARLINDVHLCDFNPLLTTSSYVNVTAEEEEQAVALIGAQIK